MACVHPDHPGSAVDAQILATIYGQCIGDAVGLLTEFMTKEDAAKEYGKKAKDLRYEQKVLDGFRNHWDKGDWTDDTDQMILILQSILYNKGKIVQTDFARRMKRWMVKGFPELGDSRGFGLGRTTKAVLNHPEFEEDPEKAAYQCWDINQRNIAPNGGVMRTSILGLHNNANVQDVIDNALSICKCTHFDPRCQASVVAVCTAIRHMIIHTSTMESQKKPKKLDVKNMIKECYQHACSVLETDEQKAELWKYLNCKKLKDLDLCEVGKIGYTYKCLGSGFWALKQDDFKKALIELVMEGGDADTNGCVAGALLGCKLGLESIPSYWIDGLKHKEYIIDLYHRFLKLQTEIGHPDNEVTSNDHLSIEELEKLACVIQSHLNLIDENSHKSEDCGS